MSISDDVVLEKLQFARQRLDDLIALNGGVLPGANPSDRQQLLQEFFFHLIGAVDRLLQLTNDRRNLGLPSEEVSFWKVKNLLLPRDPLVPHLQGLYARTLGQALPQDPYTDDAYVFRAYNYRHHVTHRNRNPFHFRLSVKRDANLSLDPRVPIDPGEPRRGISDRSAKDELSHILELFDRRCRAALDVV